VRLHYVRTIVALIGNTASSQRLMVELLSHGPRSLKAVNSMQFMFTPDDPNPWDLALSDSVLAGYRAGPFGQYFPVGAIVARSHDGHVFSFIGHGSTITTMFMAASEDLLH